MGKSTNKRGNTIAIGQPDKVSEAERDKKVYKDYNVTVKREYIEFVPKKAEVIQFDLPKVYSARDAYYSGLWYAFEVPLPNKPIDYDHIDIELFRDHFKMSRHLEFNDLANFYLLLAYANGFKE